MQAHNQATVFGEKIFFGGGEGKRTHLGTGLLKYCAYRKMIAVENGVC